jgi:hypothetical protein
VESGTISAIFSRKFNILRKQGSIFSHLFDISEYKYLSQLEKGTGGNRYIGCRKSRSDNGIVVALVTIEDSIGKHLTRNFGTRSGIGLQLGSEPT